MENFKQDYAFLRINRDNLAYESKRIRREQLNARKWLKRIIYNHDAKGQLNSETRLKGRRKYEYIARPHSYNPELSRSLWEHRRYKVRPEVRATNLALGYLTGTPYRAMEHTALHSPPWGIVWKKLTKLGGVVDNQENRDKFMQWADLPSPKPRRNTGVKDYTSHLGQPKPSIIIQHEFGPLPK